MPGATVQDALEAATALAERAHPTMFTELGENVTTLNESRSVAEHYLHVYDRIAERGLDTEISVKPTHLGMDLDPEATLANLEELAAKADEHGNWLWLDM